MTAPHDSRENVRLQVEELRALALKQPVIKCDLAELDKALYTFNNATALGADRISPSFIKALPYQGRMALAHLITTILRTCRWPWQVLCTEMVLLGKPSGGQRTIALIAMLARLVT